LTARMGKVVTVCKVAIWGGKVAIFNSKVNRGNVHYTITRVLYAVIIP